MGAVDQDGFWLVAVARGPFDHFKLLSPEGGHPPVEEVDGLRLRHLAPPSTPNLHKVSTF